jgi:hypothetical protein
MVELTSLWLPIVASAVAIFFLSFLMWMVLPHHEKDLSALPNEDALMKTLRDQGVKPGLYGFPHCTRANMKDPAWIAKQKAGPSGFLNVTGAGACNMGAALGKWMVLLLAISVVTAYVAGIALPPGAEYMTVFRVTASCMLLAFCSNLFSDAIWKGLPMRGVLMHLFDGVVYALVAGGIFGWLWPEAALLP